LIVENRGRSSTGVYGKSVQGATAPHEEGKPTIRHCERGATMANGAYDAVLKVLLYMLLEGHELFV
jgi:hypothetical protein